MENNHPQLHINLTPCSSETIITPKPSSPPSSQNRTNGFGSSRTFTTIVRGLTAQKHKIAGVSSFTNRSTSSSRNRATTLNGDYCMSVQERLNRILLKDERTDEEAQLVFKLIKSNAFFEKFLEMNDNLEAQSLVEICKQIKYEKFFANTTVCKQGDASNGKLYIVFSGELSVCIKNPDLITTQNVALEEKEKKAEAEKEKTAKRNSIQGPHIEPISPKKMTIEVSSPRKMTVTDIATPRKMTLHSNSPRKTVVLDGFPSPEKRPSIFQTEKKGMQVSPNVMKGLTKLAIVSKMIAHTTQSRKPLDPQTFKEVYGIVVDTVQKGGFFGERALLTNQPRAATIYCNTDCELLVLTKEVFLSLKTRFDKKKNKIVDFILKSIPCVDQLASGTVVEKLYYLFKERTYEYGNTIISEDSKGEHIFLVFEGSCEIIKNVKIDHTTTLKSSLSQITPLLGLGKTSSQQVMLCTIPQGTFFGEELMFEKSDMYKYTVKVSSPKAVVFAIQKSRFKMRFPRNTYWDMKDLYSQKLASHDKRLTELLSSKYNTETMKRKISGDDEKGRVSGDSAERTKIVAKEPSPYYNVFKKSRPMTSCRGKGPTSDQTLNDDLLMSLNIPQDDGEIFSLVKKENHHRNLLNRRKLGSAHQPQRSLTEHTNNDMKIEYSHDVVLTSRRERVETDADHFEMSPKSVRHLCGKQVNNTRSYGIRDPTARFRNEYFEKIEIIMPSLKVNAENLKREEIINNISNFRMDVGKPEPYLEKKYKLKKMQSKSREASNSSERSKNVDAIIKIQSSLLTRKKKFEKRSQKKMDNFRGLVQSRSPSAEDSTRFGGGTISLKQDICGSSVQNIAQISTINNEYALKPRTDRKAFTTVQSKHGTMSVWKSDQNKTTKDIYSVSDSFQPFQDQIEEKEPSLMNKVSYRPERKINKILKTFTTSSTSVKGGSYITRVKEQQNKDYGFDEL